MKRIIYLIIFLLIQIMIFPAENRTERAIAFGSKVGIEIIGEGDSMKEAFIISLGKFTFLFKSTTSTTEYSTRKEKRGDAFGNYGNLKVLSKIFIVEYPESSKNKTYKINSIKYLENNKKLEIYGSNIISKDDNKYEFQISEDNFTFKELIKYMKEIGFVVENYKKEEKYFVTIKLGEDEIKKYRKDTDENTIKKIFNNK